ncbi:hypothetical protein ARMGADRAFT_1036489 [Armillaria gallica]|uniref:CxC2-like cysteine cluster KDZ transposase-associated domain-containing protein n=1 Tax=Armillaria gallica TaxID=47427 RepID=A0A2H3D336_ARMGA|nr:hypothetical protein ARMGADRAFT_1036489 [Armillaria gallica]
MKANRKDEANVQMPHGIATSLSQEQAHLPLTRPEVSRLIACHPVIKKRKLCADEEPTLLSDWVPHNNWVSTCDNMDFDEDGDYSQFEMKGWQQYAPDFAMDASGELREKDDPMYMWMPFSQTFLNETLRWAKFGGKDEIMSQGERRCRTISTAVETAGSSSSVRNAIVAIINSRLCTGWRSGRVNFGLRALWIASGWFSNLVLDRYKAFARMSRQWVYLKRLRRAGIGHLKDGLESAEEGSVAVQCWACPQEGVNLPPDWEKVPKKEQLQQWNKHKQDHPLYKGLGYQVPPKPYFEHLRNHVKEVDISTCVAFAALMQKETKMLMGVGDLLKGERTLHLLKYKEGSGKMDGEGVEQVWPNLNQMAMQTKEMHPEVRHDALEDKGNQHNFWKNIGLGYILEQHLKLALEESDIQDKAFDDIDSTLKEDLHAEWAAMIDAWKHDNTQPNLYMSRSKTKEFEATVSKVEVRLKLCQDELAELAKGTQAVKGKSVMAFLTAALELEDMQQHILTLTQDSMLTLSGENNVHEHRLAFFKKLKGFWMLQRTYMPGVIALIEEEELHHDAKQVTPKAEEVCLWLPSHVPESERVFLLEGQCTDALASLHTCLFTKQHLIRYRNNNVTSQYMSTRARTMIQSISNRIKAVAAKYHQAWTAMKELRESGGPEDNDMVLLHESVCVEWSKALVRRDRWHEEVKLLHEEMRHVLWSLWWEALEWHRLTEQDYTNVGEEL